MRAITMVPMKPPNAPSRVLPGLMEGQSFTFPRALPNAKAKVSLAQVEKSGGTSGIVTVLP